MNPVRTFLSLTLALAMIFTGGASAASEEPVITPVPGASEKSFDETEYLPVMEISPGNDFRTDLQYSYLKDPNPENVSAYAHGAEQLSLPRGIICDFSEDDIGDAKSYIIQRASSIDFTDASTIENLPGKSYTFQNLLLGEHFFWRGGTSLETIKESPIHEITATVVPPAHLLCGRRNEYS